MSFSLLMNVILHRITNHPVNESPTLFPFTFPKVKDLLGKIVSQWIIYLIIWKSLFPPFPSMQPDSEDLQLIYQCNISLNLHIITHTLPFSPFHTAGKWGYPSISLSTKGILLSFSQFFFPSHALFLSAQASCQAVTQCHASVNHLKTHSRSPFYLYFPPVQSKSQSVSVHSHQFYQPLCPKYPISCSVNQFSVSVSYFTHDSDIPSHLHFLAFRLGRKKKGARLTNQQEFSRSISVPAERTVRPHGEKSRLASSPDDVWVAQWNASSLAFDLHWISRKSCKLFDLKLCLVKCFHVLQNCWWWIGLLSLFNGLVCSFCFLCLLMSLPCEHLEFNLWILLESSPYACLFWWAFGHCMPRWELLASHSCYLPQLNYSLCYPGDVTICLVTWDQEKWLSVHNIFEVVSLLASLGLAYYVPQAQVCVWRYWMISTLTFYITFHSYLCELKDIFVFLWPPIMMEVYLSNEQSFVLVCHYFVVFFPECNIYPPVLSALLASWIANSFHVYLIS